MGKKRGRGKGCFLFFREVEDKESGIKKAVCGQCWPVWRREKEMDGLMNEGRGGERK